MDRLGLSGLDPFLVTMTLVVAALIAFGLQRVHAGPTVFDRLVAVSLVSVNGVVMIAMLGVLLGRPEMILDVALAFAMLAFLLPLTLGRFFERATAERDEEDGR